MEQEYQEYETIMIPVSTGEEKEFAIMDEFDMDGRHYIVVSLIEGDEIQEGSYIYRAVTEEDGTLTVEQITDLQEYEKAGETWGDGVHCSS